MSYQDTSLLFASDFPVGSKVRDFTDPESGLRILVLKGTFSFCAYVGVESHHVIAGLEELEFDCHWGITYQDWGQDGSARQAGWYWWGWDYCHAFDTVDFGGSLPPNASKAQRAAAQEAEELLNNMSNVMGRKTKNWTVAEVCEDAFDVLTTLKISLKHSETLAYLASPRSAGVSGPEEGHGR